MGFFGYEGHIDYGHVSLDGVVQAEHKVGGALEFAILVALGLDHDDVDPGCNANDTASVHGCGQNTRHRRTVSLLVLNERPIVCATIHRPILDDPVLGGIVGILADPPRELGMVGINARVDHGDGHI